MARDFLSASKFVVTIDQAALLRQVTTGPNGKITGNEVRSYVYPIIEEARQDLVKDFYNHSVTKEIKSGPNASNSSGTLSGYGNLFSFIGFDTSQNPFEEIEAIINQRLNVRVRAVGNGKFKITILNAPSKEDIYAVSPLPWADGASWAEGIEKGISNLGSFLYRPQGITGSVSGTGVQARSKLRATSFRTQPYISKIINKFLENATKF